MSRPTKVLQVFDSLGMGGAEVWLIELIRYWSSREGSPHCDILCTSGGTAIFDEEAKRLGAQIFYVPFGRRHYSQFRKSFVEILQQHNYDAIHDHQDYAAGWHLFAARKHLPKTRAVHVHNPFYQLQLTRGKDWVGKIQLAISRRLVARYATDILGTSSDVLTQYGYREPLFGRVNVQTLHCGFQVDRFVGDRDQARQQLLTEFNAHASTRIVLFAGRIDQSSDSNHPHTHKNAPLAIKIAIESLKSDDNLLFLFAGKAGGASPDLERWVREANCQQQIRFLGVRSDIGTLMQGADLLLFPSRSEGLGMVAVEAQAAGIPVLTSTGVPRECSVVPNLVRFIDCAAPLSVWVSALQELLAMERLDPQRCRALVSASAYSIPNSAASLQAIYEKRRG